MKKEGIKFQSQVSIPVFHDSLKMDKGFIADLIVENKVIVEIKSVEKVLQVHKKQIFILFEINWN